MLCKLHDEIFDKACEWDAQGRPRRAQKQLEQPPQPQPQMLPPREIPENSAKSAEIYNKNLWRAQITACIEKHPKTASKSWLRQFQLTNKIAVAFPTPCDIEVIKEYLNTVI
jgi:hypothetical protein